MRERPVDRELFAGRYTLGRMLKRGNGVADLYDSGEADNRLYLVQPRVQPRVHGATLEASLRSGRLSVEAVLRIGIDIAGALSVAHDAGIVHRDVKPAKALHLGQLSDHAITLLAESMAGPLPEKAVATVTRLADGSPFMGAAVLRGLVECGALTASEHGWVVDDAALDEVQTERRSAAVLVRRLDLLPEGVLRALSGTGYSPLTHLRSFPVDILKIDPVLRAQRRAQRGGPGDRPRGHRHRAPARPPHRRRGDREAQAARDHAGPRVRLRPGLPVDPAGAAGGAPHRLSVTPSVRSSAW